MTILQNELLRVEIDDASLATTVTDQRSGVAWASESAGLVLQTYCVPLVSMQWYHSDSPQDCRLARREESETSVTYRVNFYEVELSCEASLTLSGEQLIIDIPEASWQLTGERYAQLISLDVLPGFGGQPRGADGYLVLPHSGGHLRYFRDAPGRSDRMQKAFDSDRRSAATFAQGPGVPSPDGPRLHAGMVYGEQGQWRDLIAYPLWGTVVGSSGWAAHVPFESGDADTAIVVTANRGTKQRCAAHARFHYRQHGGDTRVDEDRRLVLTFLDDPNLNYATIGRCYRDYLLNEAGCRPLREKPHADQALAYWLRPMLALKRFHYRNNPNPDGRGLLDIYLTCEQLDAELRRLKAAGVDNAIVQIVGINYEGHDGNHPTVFPLEERVGGEDGMRRVIATIKELGYTSSMHLNLRTWDRSSFDFSVEHVIRDRDGNTFFQASTPGGEGFHGCPAAAPRDYIFRNFPRLLDLGMTGGIYIDFILGVLFRCYHPRHPLTRRGYLQATLDYMRQARDAFGSLRTELIVAPGIDLLTGVARICTFEISEAMAGGSLLVQEGLADEAVPLQAIVFHGQVFHGVENSCLGEKDYWLNFLRMASIGAKPIEEHRGPQPQWDDYHAFEYQVLCRDLGWLQYAFIDDIRIDGDVTETTYSDGTVVRVNHGLEDQPDLPARSLHVVPGPVDKAELRLSENTSLTDREPAICPGGMKWPDNRPREGVIRSPNDVELGRFLIGVDFT